MVVWKTSLIYSTTNTTFYWTFWNHNTLWTCNFLKSWLMIFPWLAKRFSDPSLKVRTTVTQRAQTREQEKGSYLGDDEGVISIGSLLALISCWISGKHDSLVWSAVLAWQFSSSGTYILPTTMAGKPSLMELKRQQWARERGKNKKLYSRFLNANYCKYSIFLELLQTHV